jgi:ABC-type iron transport system FetAB permease component
VDPTVDIAPALATADVGGPARLRRSPSPADLRMRRLLRLPATGVTATEASARSALERSLLISTVRCLLTYIILPFVAPALGVATGVAPVIGLVVGIVALVFNVASIRRFWRADHRYRWHYTALSGTVIAMLLWLVVLDVVELIG